MDEILINIVENVIDVSVEISEVKEDILINIYEPGDTVKYDEDDLLPGYLSEKIIAGSGILLSEGTGGDADKLKIASTAVGTDEKVKYNTDDTSAGFLADKIVAGTGISLSEGTGGDADKLKIASTAVGTDEKVKYNTDDTSAGFLADKIVAGTGISLSEGTGGDADKLKITGHEAETAASIIALGIDELEFSLIKAYMI
jgi:hypothetical protein